MQLRESTRTLQTGGVQDTNQFSIKATGKAFKILSDGLYSDKPRAIIRELSCNAWDSHVAAGHQRPFEVKLPSQLDPSFWVRDFGTGLDHDDVMHLYTTYFDSTKNDSNDYTGGLGLGSKSPFSYTDQFTVTSWYGGKERVYSAYIGQNGAPGIALLATNPSSEPGGLKVSIAIQREDFDNFRKAAKLVVPWFPSKPIIRGVSSTEDYVGPEVVMRGKGFLLLKEAPFSSPSVLMGNVLYPIELNQLPSRYGRPDISIKPFPVHLYSVPLVIEMPIGSLDIAASREALSYDPSTIAALKQAFYDVDAQIQDKINKEFAALNPTSLWDANVKFTELKKTAESVSRSYLQAKGYTWQGETVDGSISIPHDWDVRVRTAQQLPFSRWNPRDQPSISVYPHTVVFLVDEKTKWAPKIEHWLDEHPEIEQAAQGYTHRWGRRSGVTQLREKILYVVTGEDLDKVEARLKGCEHVYRTSTLAEHPDHVKVAGTSPSPRRTLNSKVQVWDLTAAHRWRVPDTTPDTSKATKIFKMFNCKTSTDGTARGVHSDGVMRKLLENCQVAGILDENEVLFAVPASHRSILKKLDLEDGFVFIKRRVAELAKQYAREMWLLNRRLQINNEHLLHRGWDHHHLQALVDAGVKDETVKRLHILKQRIRTIPSDLEKKLVGLRNVMISLDNMGLMVYNSTTAGVIIPRYARKLQERYGMGTMYFASYEVRTSREDVHKPWVDYVQAINHWHNRESTGDTE